MILYHGSNTTIDKIDLKKSKPNKDFGKGFYLSEDEEQAIEMAKYKSSILGGDIVITKFEFNPEVLKNTSLKIKIFPEYSEEWADFVLANRDGKEVCNFDIVYGPIANDKVGVQIRKLKDGSINKEEFMNRLKYMKGITFQYYFGSEIAIKHLKKYE
ncbi:MAG: DUF3990 domain-containing protein [Bacteroidales bacterium]|nr:DUF3990 domain-containing protein [Bacteroidales bacterium]